jgi:hypothetical protein
VTVPSDSLEDIANRLEQAAAWLREPDLPAERAVALIDECARLATEAGARLDREARAADEGGTPGQLPLGG